MSDRKVMQLFYTYMVDGGCSRNYIDGNNNVCDFQNNSNVLLIFGKLRLFEANHLVRLPSIPGISKSNLPTRFRPWFGILYFETG